MCRKWHVNSISTTFTIPNSQKAATRCTHLTVALWMGAVLPVCHSPYPSLLSPRCCSRVPAAFDHIGVLLFPRLSGEGLGILWLTFANSGCRPELVALALDNAMPAVTSAGTMSFPTCLIRIHFSRLVRSFWPHPWESTAYWNFRTSSLNYRPL